MLDRVVTAEEAADLIEDEDSVIVGGSAGMGSPNPCWWLSSSGSWTVADLET